MITGINVVRNCIENGYPFIEAILSTYPICSEYFVNDGGSTDGTLEAIEKLSEVYPRIKIYRVPDEKNVRWDSVSKQINYMIKEANNEMMFLGNADELIHENDLLKVKECALSTTEDVLRFKRREVKYDWSNISIEYYPPARLARNYADVHQEWNSYGGDEFLYNYGWADPARKNVLPIMLYHLYNMFPGNRLNKLRNDAEYLAPGDIHRVKTYETYQKSAVPLFNPPTNIYFNLPALAKGLPYMNKYHVRECLFDKKWVEKITGINYS